MREKTPIEKREKEKNLREHGLQVREKNPHKCHKQIFHGFHQSKHSHPKQITAATESNPSLSSASPWLRIEKKTTTKKTLPFSEHSVFGFIGSFLITPTVH